MKAPTSPQPFVMPPDTLNESVSRALLQGAVIAVTPHVAAIGVVGPGAVQCLQGLLTNDLVTPGDAVFQYTALLTAKGMIVSDMWAARRGEAVTLYPPASARESVIQVLGRSLPPRLAKIADRSDTAVVCRLAGPRGLDIARAAGLPAEPGRSEAHSGLFIGAPASDGPFAAQVEGPQTTIEPVLQALGDAGAVTAPADVLEAARILAGWPGLGAEIGEKTLPQEVRFDDLDGVSHSKGCYLGQETVARVHFRGHVNKRVLGLTWDAPPDFSRPEISRGDRPVGHITSAVWIAPFQRYVGLGILRREIEPDTEVLAGAQSATTFTPPYRPALPRVG